MSYQFIGAAATHFQITGASFYNFAVGSVTVLVSIRKLDDWDVVTTTSDRAASAVPLVSGWEGARPHNKHSAHCVVTSGRGIPYEGRCVK